MPSTALASSQPRNAPILIIALSGRTLASAAWNAGYPVVVIDLYNDLDTRNFAIETRRVKEFQGGFDNDELVRLVQECSSSIDGIVVGTGFESCPDLLDTVIKGKKLYGNDASVVTRIKDPNLFFTLLDKLGVPHPEVSFSIPDPTNGWLRKKIGGHGGIHISQVVKDTALHPGFYFQRIARGRSVSVLFLANGSEARVIGFNQLFSAGLAGRPYWYGGAVNNAEISSALETEISHKLNLIVKETGLVGLNGMDFIVDGDDYKVLEINPRPPATLDLHDSNYENCLFHLHLEACKGCSLDDIAPKSKEIKAHAIIYAPNQYRVPSQLHFPEWCTDIPEAGSEFLPRAPVCMVHAKGTTVIDTERQLIQRREFIENAMRKKII
jgi:predicted ATP-grasp superfamily ATP-dependent carboligase